MSTVEQRRGDLDYWFQGHTARDIKAIRLKTPI